jgi:hypothetical protein
LYMKGFANIVILSVIVIPLIYLSYRMCDIEKEIPDQKPFSYMSPRRKLFCHYPVIYLAGLLVVFGMIWGYR